LKFGATKIPNGPWDELVRRWRDIDALRALETLWIPDHLFKGWWECWQALAGAASPHPQRCSNRQNASAETSQARSCWISFAAEAASAACSARTSDHSTSRTCIA